MVTQFTDQRQATSMRILHLLIWMLAMEGSKMAATDIMSLLTSHILSDVSKVFTDNFVEIVPVFLNSDFIV